MPKRIFRCYNNHSRRTVLLSILFICCSVVQANWPKKAGCDVASPIGLRALLANVYKSFGDVANLIGSIAYIGGLAFVASGILKLKQFRDNPSQVTIATPITYILVGVSLIFLPSLINVTRESIFTSVGSLGQVTSSLIISNPFARKDDCS